MQTGKTVLVTGASRGIGRACARRFCKAGFSIALSYRQNEEAARMLSEELSEQGARVFLYRADLSDERETLSLSEGVQRDAGFVEVLVNNAGESLRALVTDTKDQEYDHLMALNLKAPFLLSRELSRAMVREKKGAIVNISSIWGQTGASMETVYSASKAGLVGFTKALAKELGPSGVRVNCVCPGVIETDMMRGFASEDCDDLCEDIPLCRFGYPQEVAEAVYFLASEASSYITGQCLAVNGGMLA